MPCSLPALRSRSSPEDGQTRPRLFEAEGIATYLHVPSPDLLKTFLEAGSRRFIFEGRECGGHVGPRSSFVLWESMIRVLLQAGLSDEEAAKVHVAFAGGIHDALSGSMVSAIAQPLVRRGIKVGALLGTAYLFTEEIVRTGAIVSKFQDVAIDCDQTALVESGPGHAIRCAETDYVQFFADRKQQLSSRWSTHRGDSRGTGGAEHGPAPDRLQGDYPETGTRAERKISS